MRETTAANVARRFQQETAAHEMRTVLDQGLHRHLTFKAPGTFACGFHITTWPGYLCISGDMGCYVFARLPDMFEFFRGARINPQYWAEKLQADNRSNGHKEFSRELFVAAVVRDFRQWEFDSGADRLQAFRDLRRSGPLSRRDDYGSPQDAIAEALSYTCFVSGNDFADFWEHDVEDYTFHFLWCCHAIRWAIERYDEANAAAEQVAA